MSKHLSTRARWLVLSTLSLFAAVTPQASAQEPAPTWSCRASAAYVELDLLLDARRVEPILANGNPDRDAPDNAFCADDRTGLQDIEVVEGPAPLITLNSAFATTTIDPDAAPARQQTATADGGVLDSLLVSLGALEIEAAGVTSHADASCVGTTPRLRGDSTTVSLRIGTTVIELPTDGSYLDINLPGLLRVQLNQQVRNGVGTSEEELIQRAVVVDVLAALGGEPLTRVVIGEAKVDLHGDVCAPPPPPTPCPPNTTPIPDSDPPLCQLIVVQCAPGSVPNPDVPNTCVLVCPAGSSAGAGGACVVPTPCGAGTTNQSGVCVATAVTCPAGTTREPNSNTCVLLVQRPCPTGATPDPVSRVCVLRVAGGTTVASSGENGRIGSADGPRATCGILSMRFVRGQRNLGTSYTSRFGNRTVTRGRLVTCGSNPRPIVGARIDVVHILPGNKRRRKTGLRSRANGLLTLILPIDLRTRRIEYAYRPNLNTTRVTSRRTLTLTVKNKAGRILR